VGHLFDWLVVGQVVPINPAASEPDPRHVVRAGKTAVLEPAEARALWFASPKCFGMLPAARLLPACTSSARGKMPELRSAKPGFDFHFVGRDTPASSASVIVRGSCNRSGWKSAEFRSLPVLC